MSYRGGKKRRRVQHQVKAIRAEEDIWRRQGERHTLNAGSIRRRSRDQRHAEVEASSVKLQMQEAATM